jgi:non-specific serine/threonine protein kinase
MQGLTAFECGDYEQATARALEAREAANVSGEIVQQSGPLMILANIAVSRGNYDRAQELYEQSIEASRRDGATWGLGILLSAAAGLRIVRGDFEGARVQAAEAMSFCQELEDPRGIAWSFDVFAGLLAAGGHAAGAARLWGASDRLLANASSSLSPEIRWIRDRYIEPVKTSLGVGPFATACAAGRAMPLAHAIALAASAGACAPLSFPVIPSNSDRSS